MARTRRDPSLGRNAAREPAAAAPPAAEPPAVEPLAAATAGEAVEPAPVVEAATRPVPPPILFHPPMPATWGVPEDQLPPWNPTWDRPPIRGIELPDSLRATLPGRAPPANNTATGPLRATLPARAPPANNTATGPLLTIPKILEVCRVAEAHIPTVKQHLMPNGLKDLEKCTDEDINNAAKSFARLPLDQRFDLSSICIRRLKDLVLAVKDRVRFNRQVGFPDRENFYLETELSLSYAREETRKAGKKIGDLLSTHTIKPPLSIEAEWDDWSEAIKNALASAYGMKGVPLLYVTRENDEPMPWNDLEEEHTSSNLISCPSLSGFEYEMDKQKVHAFILKNIASGSEAYHYIKPLIVVNNGRADWKALERRYEGPAMVKKRLDVAERTWNDLNYKSESIQTFESFCQTFYKMIRAFAKAGVPRFEGDIISWLWKHINSPDVNDHKRILQTHYETGALPLSEDRPYHEQILQQIALHIPSSAKAANQQFRLSELKTQAWTADASLAPSRGAMTSDGKLYVGYYSAKQWLDPSMAPHREAITSIRKAHNLHQDKKKPLPKHKGGAHKGKSKVDFKKSKEYQQLNRKIAALQKALKTPPTTPQGDSSTITDSTSGDAFGGRSSRGGQPHT